MRVLFLYFFLDLLIFSKGSCDPDTNRSFKIEHALLFPIHLNEQFILQCTSIGVDIKVLKSFWLTICALMSGRHIQLLCWSTIH